MDRRTYQKQLTAQALDAEPCPVHEPGDLDCTPDYGAPCIGAHDAPTEPT